MAPSHSFTRFVVYVAASVLFPTLGTAANTTSYSCLSFSLSNVTNAVVTGRTVFDAGDNVTLTTPYQSISVTTLPAFCRLEFVITTNSTANSTAKTEVWLPDSWNGRFLTIGNGGLSGGVAVADLGFIAVGQGYAGVSTDTGHESLPTDGSWAGPHNDNAIIDYAHKKSYYIGCSAGGRQGLKEAQEFPEDFDGIVIGSPANWNSHLTGSIVHSVSLVQPSDSSRFIPEDVWSNVIHPEVLRQCDVLDGVSVHISSPIHNFPAENQRLTFTLAGGWAHQRSASLQLPSRNPRMPSEPERIDMSFYRPNRHLAQIYTDYYETNQTYVFGGFYPGAELSMFSGPFGADPGPLPYAQDIFRYFIFNDTTWTIDQYDFPSVLLAESINPGNGEANSPNLTVFATSPHSGKIMHYVGWAENFISAGNSLHYYESVNAWMRTHQGIEMDSFYRLFTVPGMEHCLGGGGANAFGGVFQEATSMPPLLHDADHDVLAAMVKWVEEGVAPSSIVATAYTNNDVQDGIAFTRPLCKYPTMAMYSGGDPNNATSFTCA